MTAGPAECKDEKPTSAPTTQNPWGSESPAEMVLEVEAYYCGCGPAKVVIKGCRFCAQPNSCDAGKPQPGQKWLAYGCDIGSEEDDDDETSIPDNAITLAKFNRHGDFEQYGSNNPYMQLSRWNPIEKLEEVRKGDRSVHPLVHPLLPFPFFILPAFLFLVLNYFFQKLCDDHKTT